MAKSHQAEQPRPGEPWHTPPAGFGAIARSHGRVFRESVEHMSTHLVSTLFVWLITGVALLFPSSLYLVLMNLNEALTTWRGNVHATAYFEVATQSAVIDDVVSQLRRESPTLDIEVVSSSDAMEEFGELVGLPDFADEADIDPLPAALLVRSNAITTRKEISELQDRLQQFEQIVSVVTESNWVTRLNAIKDFAVNLFLVFAVIFGIGAVCIVAVTTRVAIESRLDEIHIVSLFGGTNRYLRRPFVYCGALYGLGGGIVACMLLAGVAIFLSDSIAQLQSTQTQEPLLSHFNVYFLCTVVSIGGVLGLLGASIQVRQRIRQLHD